MEEAGGIRRLRVAGAIAVLTIALLTIALATFTAWRHSGAAGRTDIVNRSALRRGQSVSVLYRAERLVRFPNQVPQLNAAIAKLDASQVNLHDLTPENQAFYERFHAAALAVAQHPRDRRLRDGLESLGDSMYHIFYVTTVAYSDRAGVQRERSFWTTMFGSGVMLLVLGLLYAFVMRPSVRFVGENMRELLGALKRLDQRDERTRALYRIASAPDVAAGAQIDDALALGAAALGMEYGFVSRIVDGIATIQHRLAPDDLLPVEGSFASLSIGQKIFATLHAISVDDLTTEANAAELRERGLGWKSCIGGAVVVDGLTYGLLVFFSNRVREPGFDQADRDFIDLMGALIGSALGRQRLQSVLSEMAFHDALTGLANRALLEEHVKLALGQAQRTHDLVAVHYLDLNQFKPVNDEYGHDAGDVVLREAARRFSAAVRSHDVVARIGGDEFVVLQTGVHDDAPIYHLAQRLHQAMHDKVVIADGLAVSVGVSVGTAIFPSDGSDVASLLRAADAAMYREKSARI